jgi:hypothetical protein
MKIRPMGAELFHADKRTDRQTDITKLKITFLNFANAPKISLLTEPKVFKLTLLLLSSLQSLTLSHVPYIQIFQSFPTIRQ